MTKERALTAWAGAGLGVAVAMITLAAPYASGQTVRNYDVNLTSTAPVIDGVVSPGEWDAASAAAGDWRELRKDESDVDTENNRFRMLWDDTNLYILYETDFGTYFDPIDKVNNPNPTISFGEDNLNLYIDPNTNGLPGINQLRTIVGAVMTIGLILSVLALIVSAIVWGFGANSSNPHLASRGKVGVLVSCGAAVICGASVTLINFFWNVGQSV